MKDYKKVCKQNQGKMKEFIKHWNDISLSCNGLKQKIEREKDGENIKKQIIGFLSRNHQLGFMRREEYDNYNLWIDWLEKQGKKISWKPSKEEMDVLYGLAYITNQYDEHKEEVITRLYQDLKREFFNDSSYENMFPNTEDDARRRSTIQVLEYARTLDTYNQYGKADIDKNIVWLENQGEQKPVDEIEPKFKVGVWVVNKFGNVWHIDSYDKKNYQVSNEKGNYNYFPIEKQDEMHLWSIEDANPGDVLYHSDTASNGIFVFKELLEYEFGKKVICYCDYDSEDGFCLGESHTCCWANDKILHPATKEQCELLFKKMKEAGWEFDFKKKELKEVKKKYFLLTDLFNAEYERGKADAISEMQKGWTEDDKNHMANILTTLLMEAKNAKTKQYRSSVESDIDWIYSLKNKELPQPKEWSEDDDKALDSILNDLRQGVIPDNDDINWLKSLKHKE